MAAIHDGDWILFDSDIKLGRYVWVRYNDDGSTTFRTDYAVEPTIELNKAQRNMARDDWKGDYHHVASIPLNVYWDKLAEASKQDDQKFINRWLNDSDNRAWRTKGGTL